MSVPAEHDEAAEREGGERGRLLVVDDEQQLRVLFARSLTRAGYDVHVAKDGHEALELARQQRFDLVISDVHMPGLTGWQLLRALREEDPKLPVALISGAFDELAPDLARELGAFACLDKPVPFQELHRLAELAVADRRAKAGLALVEPCEPSSEPDPHGA